MSDFTFDPSGLVQTLKTKSINNVDEIRGALLLSYLRFMKCNPTQAQSQCMDSEEALAGLNDMADALDVETNYSADFSSHPTSIRRQRSDSRC